jgi:hypothetical protein
MITWPMPFNHIVSRKNPVMRHQPAKKPAFGLGCSFPDGSSRELDHNTIELALIS